VKEWNASLNLQFAKRGEKTALVDCLHHGPLRVQKMLYPEGAEICHAVILHPPGGIAGGDSLSLHCDIQQGAHALLTTPGATKWYRSGGHLAQQNVRVKVGEAGVFEWLPQENIFFDGVEASLAMSVELAPSASFIGFELCCLGRVASNEHFLNGQIRSRTQIRKEGHLIWSERGLLKGGSPWLSAAPGLRGCPFYATLLAAGAGLSKKVLDECRDSVMSSDIYNGITIPSEDLLVARCLAYSAESVQEWFLQLWSVLRLALLHRAAVTPRLWNT
jgi:urease accessory protein